MTFAAQIEEEAGGADKIVSAVVGLFGWAAYHDEEPDTTAYGFDREASRMPFPPEMRFKPQSWDVVRKYLDYNHDQGYGAPECHAVFVYTEDSVIFVSTYDGSTDLEKIPRNPSESRPEMYGGG
jgi:hypothetical protein